MTERPSVTEPIAISLVHTHPFDPPAALRDVQPIRRVRFTDGEIGWLVTSHALAKLVLTDSRFGRDRPGTRLRGGFGDSDWMAKFSDACEAVGYRPMRGFIEMNPPDHTRIRRLLASQFTVRRIAEFRPRIEQIVTEHLDALAQMGQPADLVSAFTTQVSLSTQCAFLGIPHTDSRRFFRLGTGIFDTSLSAMNVANAWREAYQFVRDVAVEKRLHPTDDLLSFVASHGELTDDEVADTALVLFQGGLETTGDMMALGAFALLCHPDQLDALREDSSLIGSAVEELLRYSGIFRLLPRTALEDVDLDSNLVKAGELVTVSLAAANRDPMKFDAPDDLRLRRSAIGHVAFAQGIHMCLGQHLARLELQIGLGNLIRRFPALRLSVAPDDVPVYSPIQPIYGVYQLPVAWSAEPASLPPSNFT